MPRLLRCVDGDHFYVRAAVGRLPVTFQLKPEGWRELRACGWKHGDTFEWDTLHDLIDRGLAYTGHSGVTNRFPERDSKRTAEWDEADELIGEGPPHRTERRVWLWFEAADWGTLDATVVRITADLSSAGGVVEGPYPLPSRCEHYTALGPDGRRKYTMLTHKRLLVVVNPLPATFAAVQGTGLPDGVSVRLRETITAVETPATDRGR